MKKQNIKVTPLPSLYLKEDGTYDKEAMLNISGKIAGECYDEVGFEKLINEPIEKTQKRVNDTRNNGHHSVYGHYNTGICFEITNLPKLLAMQLNNEHEYNTSEKSARYTKIKKGDNSPITLREIELYNKWVEIFTNLIKEQYGNIFKNFKIRTLAQENARYLVSVKMPTNMIYSTSLRQINYLASWMRESINNANLNDPLESYLKESMQELLDELDRINILDEGLMQNEKNRGFTLFGKDLEKREEYFGDVYSTNYKGTPAQLAQAHRHRPIYYQMKFLPNKEYFVPPILKPYPYLVEEWLKDISSVANLTPQGELVLINERGIYEKFIEKCKERLCSAAQLEIMQQTRATLENYKKALEAKNHPLAQDIAQYSHGARCTFPDFTCSKPCGFEEGILLKRKI